MKLKYFALSLLGLFALLFTSSVSAEQYGCNGQYGGYGPECPTNQSIFIDKMVGKPTTMTKGGQLTIEFVDNLSDIDYRFKPSDFVYFQLRVKNTSDKDLDVTVQDILPSYVEPTDMPANGSYDTNSRVITIKVGNMKANEEKIYTLKTKLVETNKFPADKSLLCIVNKAEAKAPNVFDDDSAQFCVEKQVTGATKVPSAGPEMGLALLAGELGLLGLGIGLRKRTS